MRLKYVAKTHAYWLDGKRCKSPSAIAKVPDDQHGLTNWRLRQVALGIATDPSKFLTEIGAHSNDTKALDALCEQAIGASKGNSGRDRGTALHLITEKLDAGEDLWDTPAVLEIKAKWQALLSDYGLNVVKSEGVVLYPGERIAGRFDRIVTDGDQLYVLDIKGGAGADKYVHAHCVQLAMYANAPLMAELPTGDVDFEVEDFTPMLDVSKHVGLVAHIPEAGEPKVIAVDIAAGMRCFEEVIKPTWGWRQTTGLAQPFAIRSDTGGYDKRDELLARIDAVLAVEAASLMLRSSWPDGVPTRKGSDQWTSEQMREIDAVVVRVEAEHQLPFLPVAIVDAPAPVPVEPERADERVIDEGLSNELLAAELGQAFKAMAVDAPDAYVQANAWAAEANRSGVPISLKQEPSERRCQIVRIIIAALDSVDDVDEKMRGFLELNLGADRVQPGFTTGAVLGSLDVVEATRLAEIICP